MGETNRARIREIEAELGRRARIQAIEVELNRRASPEAEGLGGGSIQESRGDLGRPLTQPVPSQAASPPTQEDAAEMMERVFREARGAENPSLNRDIPVSPDPRAGEATILGVPVRGFLETPGAQAVRALGQSLTGDIATSGAAELTGRGLGAGIGTAIGGPPGAAIGSVLGGAAGALLVQRLARGEKVTSGDIAIEAGLSILPDVVAAPLVRGGQRLLSRTSRGIETGKRAGAARLAERVPQALAPPEKEAVDQLFNLVRASGDRLDPRAFVPDLKDLTDDQFKNVTQQLRRIQAPPGKQNEAIGEAAVNFFTNLRRGNAVDVDGVEMGWLQHVSSQLRQRAARLSPGAQRDAVESFRESIDDVMLTTGAFIRGGESRPLLIEARRQFAKLKDSEEFGVFLRRGLTPRTTAAGNRTLNLRKLADTLSDPLPGKETGITKILNKRPELKTELTTFLTNMGRVNLEPGLLSKISPGLAVLGGTGAGIAGTATRDDKSASNFAPLGIILGSIMLAGPASRARFNRLVRDNDNTLTMPMLAVMVNSLRRETAGTGNPLPAAPELQASPL